MIPMCEYSDKEEELDLSILKGKNVLVVDDNPNNIMRLCSYLDKWGMDYRECDSGQRALLQYVGKERWHFDIGLIDIIMPGVDGNELAERIQNSDYPFPVVAVSSEYSRNDGISPVFSFTLFKPYNEIQLAKTIISVLTNTSTDGGISASINVSAGTPEKGSSGSSSPKPYKKSDNSLSIPMMSRSKSDTGYTPYRSKNKGSIRFKNVDPEDSGEHSASSGGSDSPRKKQNLSSPKRNIFSRVFDTGSPEKKIHEELMNDVRHGVNRDGMLGTYNESADATDVNILIAEDHLFNQKVIVSMLSSMGFNNIDMAENGRDAVELIKVNRGVEIKKNRKSKFTERSSYDLILMDIQMPVMDGVQAAIAIDDLFKHRVDRPKIVAVTANAMAGDKERYLTEGRMDDYISKPITSKEVLYDVIP